MKCHYFDQNQCRSCSLLAQDYQSTLKQKHRDLTLLMQSLTTPSVQVAPVCGMPDLNIFPMRNKAKMVVSGQVTAPQLGIIETDLAACPLYYPGTLKLLARLKAFITQQKLIPYNIKNRSGELKYILIHESPLNNQMMLRFVLKDKSSIQKILPALAQLQLEFPALKVISANIQSVHQAIIEGPEEVFLTEQTTIIHQLGNFSLTLSPQCFFQTNSVMAERLYQQARVWVQTLAPTRFLDLYCGVGGFSFFMADLVNESLGIELSAESIRCANLTKTQAQFDHLRFLSGDVADLVQQYPQYFEELVLVNPPRAGLRESVRAFLLDHNPRAIVYSSCNPQTLVRDLNELSLRYEIREVMPFDMFPYTEHLEVLVLLIKTDIANCT